MRRVFNSHKSSRHRLIILATACTPLLFSGSSASGQRVYGINVSSNQGTINWSSVKNAGGKSFAFIRASRGGTTGSFINGNTVGQGRYDDPDFVTYIDSATAVGMLAGPYHFARADITGSTGADEAAHFLQDAGPFMRPGYLLPSLDLEAGSQLTTAQLSQWVLDFSNAIHAAKGVYPIVYVNSSYAVSEVNSSIPALMPNLWLARPDANSNPASGDPIAAFTYPNAYGVWNPSYPNTPNPAPWQFWQYLQSQPGGTVPGINTSIDLNVAHGDIDYVKDFQVPALWAANASGTWSTTSNWNTNNAGYVSSNPATGPASRLPGANDNIVLDNSLSASNYTVSFTTGTTASIRRFTNKQTFNMTGGILSISLSAIIAGPTTLSAGSLNITQSLSISAGSTFSNTGGALTLGTSTTPAAVTVAGTFTQSAGSLAVAANSIFTNTGVTTLGGTQSWGAGSSYIHTSGTTTFNSDAGSPTSFPLAITASGSTGVTFNSTQHLASLTIPAGGRAALAANGSRLLATKSLSITTTSSGKLDLNNNDLIYDYTGSTPAEAVRQYLLTARNNGTWSGTGGLTSTSAANDAQKRTALGYAESSQLLSITGTQTATWDGQTVDATSLLVKYTWYGDANLDGVVDADDYALLDRGLAKHLTGWINGDFNYDGSVTSADYLLIDRVFSQQSGTLSPDFLAMRESQFGETYVADLLSSIPEPSSWACLAMALPLLLCRRWRVTQIPG